MWNPPDPSDYVDARFAEEEVPVVLICPHCQGQNISEGVCSDFGELVDESIFLTFLSQL